MGFGIKDFFIHDSWHKNTFEYFVNEERSEMIEWLFTWLWNIGLVWDWLRSIDCVRGSIFVWKRRSFFFGLSTQTLSWEWNNELISSFLKHTKMKSVNIKWLRQTANIKCIHEFSLWTTAKLLLKFAWKRRSFRHIRISHCTHNVYETQSDILSKYYLI